MTKNAEQKLKYLKNEKSFHGEIKSIFHHLWKDFHLLEIVSDLTVRF